MRVTFDDLDPFASQGSALSLIVGPETGGRTTTFTKTVTHWFPANMAGISIYVMQHTHGESNSIDTAPTDTSIASKLLQNCFHT